MSVDPYFQFRHMRQQTGLDGLNLEKSHRKEIEEAATKITRDSIESFDNSQFHVASQTKLGHFYSVNPTAPSCTCQDFPCIQFCKHIGVIYFHFPHLCPSSVPATSQVSSAEPGRATTSGTPANKFNSLMQDVNTLSNQLVTEATSQSAPLQDAVEAVRTAKASLTAAIASVKGSNPLPERERIVPRDWQG
jgi:hypothetical protein